MRRAVSWMYVARGGGDRKRFPSTPDLILEERNAVGAVILITLIMVAGPVSRGHCEDWSRLRTVWGGAAAPHS